MRRIDGLGVPATRPSLRCPHAEGLAPWTPVIRDGKLYGRGGADDGYAMFGSLTALRALAGIVASSFRILRERLDRIEDVDTGRILLDDPWVEIPQERLEQARAAAAVLGDSVHAKLPFVPGMRPITDDPFELLLNGTWRPSLAVTGADGLPDLGSAGNVLRPYSSVKLSFRLPPGVDPEAAARSVKIPFMNMLGERFPDAQFLVTGVLGPQSNAHGPNEFLHIETGKRLTACVADVVAAHAARK